MNNYIITFEGIGYDLVSEDGHKIGGFFVNVLARESEPGRAFEIAHQKLISNKAYQDLISESQHPDAVLRVHQFNVILDDDANEPEISGFIFFPPD